MAASVLAVDSDPTRDTCRLKYAHVDEVKTSCELDDDNFSARSRVINPRTRPFRVASVRSGLPSKVDDAAAHSVTATRCSTSPNFSASLGREPSTAFVVRAQAAGSGLTVRVGPFALQTPDPGVGVFLLGSNSRTLPDAFVRGERKNSDVRANYERTNSTNPRRLFGIVTTLSKPNSRQVALVISVSTSARATHFARDVETTLPHARSPAPFVLAHALLEASHERPKGQLHPRLSQATGPDLPRRGVQKRRSVLDGPSSTVGPVITPTDAVLFRGK